MSPVRIPVCAILVLAMLAAVDAALSQDYPGKVVRMTSTEAGGGSDFTARLIVPGLSANLGQQVIIDNRVALIAIETVAKAPSDGYTLLLVGSPLWLSPLMRNVSFDPVRDFAPVALVTSSPCMLVVHPALPVTSVAELIALAKARPGEINYAAGGTGSSNHLAAELFKNMTGVKMVGIQYKGVGPAVNALIGGEVQLMFPVGVSAGPHVKSGRLKALAVTTAQPSRIYPELPTLAASGLPGFEAVAMQGIFAPANTPAAIIARLNQETARVLNRADVKEKFFNAGVETVGGPPEQLAAAIKSEMTRLGKVIKEAGIRD